MNLLEKDIVSILNKESGVSSSEIFERHTTNKSFSTIKRALSVLLENNKIIKKGNGKSTLYFLKEPLEIDLDSYFEKELDEREIKKNFNFQIFDELNQKHLFTEPDINRLKSLQNQFIKNTENLSKKTLANELERLAIDLSWKSSQIEGNTYSLLETEVLIKEKLTAGGKSKEEATLLLNHKETIDYIIENKH